MKIDQLFAPQTQLDEGPIGQAIGKGVGGLAKGVGAVAGGAVGAWNAAKQGYQAGKAAVSGQPAGSATTATTPASAPATTAPATTAPATTAPATTAAGGVAPATTAASPASGGGQQAFNSAMKAVKTLTPNQKSALAKQLEKEIGQKPAATPGATPAAAPATTAAAPVSVAPTGPQKGQEVSLASGEKYRFAGQQWVEVDPTSGAEVGGAALPAGFQKSLTGIAAKHTAAPATPATTGAPDLKVIPGGKSAVGEGLYYRSKFLNIIL